MNLDDDGEDDPFAGELLDLKALAIVDDTDACHCLDPADPDWRETLLDEVIATHKKT